MAHAILISPIGYRDPNQIYRIIRTKSRVYGPMGSIVEWQSLATQEYRYKILIAISKFWELFGVYRPIRYEKPIEAGDFDKAMENNIQDGHTLLAEYLEKPEPKLGGSPHESAPPDDE